MRTDHQPPVRVTWKPGELICGLLRAYICDGKREEFRGYVIAIVHGTVTAGVYVTPYTLDTVEEKFESTEQAMAWVEAMLIACHAMER